MRDDSMEIARWVSELAQDVANLEKEIGELRGLLLKVNARLMGLEESLNMGSMGRLSNKLALP